MLYFSVHPEFVVSWSVRAGQFCVAVLRPDVVVRFAIHQERGVFAFIPSSIISSTTNRPTNKWCHFTRWYQNIQVHDCTLSLLLLLYASRVATQVKLHTYLLPVSYGMSHTLHLSKSKTQAQPPVSQSQVTVTLFLQTSPWLFTQILKHVLSQNILCKQTLGLK